jgi:toxin ParE1/3/4
MPSPLSLSFAPSAERDIDAIAEYTFERWGGDQSRDYLATIHVELENLSRFPKTGKLVVRLKPPTRVLVMGSHVAVYRVFETEVRILRVLHERQVTRQMLESI